MQNRPYSPKYAQQKGSSKVDLTLSGDMLENMYVSNVSGNEVDISVREQDYGKLRGAEEGVIRSQLDKKGRPVKNGRKWKRKRPFFHLSENDKKAIVNDPEVDATFARALKRLKKESEDK